VVPSDLQARLVAASSTATCSARPGERAGLQALTGPPPDPAGANLAIR